VAGAPSSRADEPGDAVAACRVELGLALGRIPRWRTSQTFFQLFKALVNACRTPLEVTINPALTTLTNPDK